MRVLVTRPEPGASATAAQLEAMGLEPVVLPLSETRPLRMSELPSAGEFDAVAATSATALRHAPPELLRALAHLPLFAVGDKTAATALKAGFAHVESAAGDAPALATHIVRTLKRGSRILYRCGLVRTGGLADALRKSGFAVSAVETYDTVPVERTTEQIGAVLGGRPVDAALLYSANAAVLFARLAATPGVGPLVRAARPICISQRTAQALPQSTCDRAEIAATPDEASLLARLKGA